jgi:MFS family permease
MAIRDKRRLIAGRAPDSLWRDTSFRLLFTANTISFVGTQISRVVLPILVFQLTGSALQTSLLLALQTLPYVIFGLLAGAVADRVNRRAMMIGSDLLRSVIFGTIPIAHAFGGLTVTHVYLAALLSAIAWVWSDAANFGAFPAIVGRARIVVASTVLTSTWTIAGVIALPIGGLLATTLGPATTITIDAVSYVVAAAMLACIPTSFGTAARPSDAGESMFRRTRGDIAVGLRYLRRHELIRPLTLLGFGSSLTNGAIAGLLVVYGVRQLGLTAADARLGWLYAAGTVGALVAALVLPPLTRRFSQPRISLVGFTATFMLLVGIGLSSNLIVSLMLLFAWEGALSLAIYNGIALRQQLTPDGLQSRVNATGRMLAVSGLPLGAALGGLVADAVSVRAAVLVMAAGMGLSTLAGWLSPLRRANHAMVSQLIVEADAETADEQQPLQRAADQPGFTQ